MKATAIALLIFFAQSFSVPCGAENWGATWGGKKLPPPPPPATAQTDYSAPRSDQLLLVMLYTEHCAEFCGKVRPILAELVPTFGDKVKYVEMEVTSGAPLRRSREIGRSLGIEKLVAEGAESAPVVLILKDIQGHRHLVAEYAGAKKRNVYQNAINKNL